jgi:hypothetical protein
LRIALQASTNGHLSKASLQMEWRKTMNYQCTSNRPPPALLEWRAVGGPKWVDLIRAATVRKRR